MEIEEFEQRLHDAEVRLARLKALYEQWFQGIERTEPAIARKEFERALEALKREQPRNTALRFRCQQLSARYGTYGIYWGRIAKQIEDGTYKRDLQRAKAKAQKEKAREQQTFELDVEIDGLEDGLDGLDGFGDSDLDAILGALSAPEISVPAQASRGPKTFGKVREPERAAPARPTEPAPPPDSAPATQPAPPPPGTAARPGAPAPPRIPGASPHKPPPTVAPPAIPGARPSGPAPAGPGAATRVPPPPTKAPPPFESPPPSSGAIAIGRMVRPATPATGGIREEAGAHSRSSRPADGPPSAVMPTGARPPPGVRPAAAPARPASPAAAGGPRPAANGGPDMQALYQRYVDARRQNNERIDNVRFESLQQSVEKMMPKLREKHGNKAIDFEVVLQDGKVGLKPKVRG